MFLISHPKKQQKMRILVKEMVGNVIQSLNRVKGFSVV